MADNDDGTPRITGTEYLVSQYNLLTREFSGDKKAVKSTMNTTSKQVSQNEHATIENAQKEWQNAKKAMMLQRRLIHEKFEFLKKLMKRRYNELIRIRKHLLSIEQSNKEQVQKEDEIALRQKQLDQDRANVQFSRKNLENEKENLAGEMEKLRVISQKMNQMNLDFTTSVTQDETLQELDRLLREMGFQAYGMEVRLSQMSSISTLSNLTGLAYNDANALQLGQNFSHKNDHHHYNLNDSNEFKREYFENLFSEDENRFDDAFYTRRKSKIRKQRFHQGNRERERGRRRSRSRSKSRSNSWSLALNRLANRVTRSTSPVEMHSDNHYHLEMSANRKLTRKHAGSNNDEYQQQSKATKSRKSKRPRSSSLFGKQQLFRQSSQKEQTRNNVKKPKSKYSGRLIIRLIEARHIFGRKGKKANTYVLMELNDQLQKSQTIKNDENPNWNECFKFKVDNYNQDRLKLTLMDERRGDCIATMTIPVKDFVENFDTDDDEKDVERISSETLAFQDNMEMNCDIAFEHTDDFSDESNDIYDSKSRKRKSRKKRKRKSIFNDMLRRTFPRSNKKSKESKSKPRRRRSIVRAKTML